MILDALDLHAHERSASFAIDEVTYAELRDGAARVAESLRAIGVAASDRVIIYAENAPGFVFAYLGALRAGAIVVPANVLYRESDLARIVEDSGARVMCVSARSRPFVATAFEGTLVDLADVAAWAKDTRIAPFTRDRTPEDIALLVYTSGTTGRAKGAMLTHANLAAIASQVTRAWAWTSRDTLLLSLPLFHIHGLCAGINGTLVAGARVLLRERFEVGDVVATLRAGDATMFFGVPTMYVRILEHAGPGPFSAVRLFVSGSAALPASVHEAFVARFDASILERYGSTEFGFALTNRYDGARYPGTVGFPFPGVRARLVDANDRESADGDIGEILVNGPNVCAGYWRDADATAAAFVSDADGTRWFRSGDLATYDSERGYAIVGRTKELIISGGFNIYPREIEDELMRIDGIRAAAVIGRPDAARGELPIAYVEVEGAIDIAAVLATLRAKLASFKIPREMTIVDELPRNAMGKIDKPALRARLAT
jgi:malonyl-CoA/methylmalonyl-CoA synthetase